MQKGLKMSNELLEWRNSAGKKLFEYNPARNKLEIMLHGFKTEVMIEPNGTFRFTNYDIE